MKVDTEFDMKQTVFLRTDKDQLPRMVTAIKLLPGQILYQLSQGVVNSNHYDFEISAHKDVMLSSTN